MSVTPQPCATLRDRIAAHFLPDPPERLGVAVSGGSDSLGLLVLLDAWRRDGGPALEVVTVDHGLRPQAAEEARQVADFCDRLGLRHATLPWQGWDGRGNLPGRARAARYGLMADWARSREIGQIALGHTADDLAETLLMRLAREAGVDGLSAMAATRLHDGVVFCRPCLEVTRAGLQAVLQARGIGWATDPSNADQTFERARARQALTALAPLGITAQGLARVAGHLGGVRDTLYHYVYKAARALVRLDRGDILIERSGFAELPDEVARRLLLKSLAWVNGDGYGPRGRALEQALQALRRGDGQTLQGCLMTVERTQIRVTREAQAVAGVSVPAGEVWDGRWRLLGPQAPGDRIAALGQAGLSACPDRHDSGLPSASLQAGPAVWRGGDVVAAPLAGLHNGWRAKLVRDDDEFFTAILSH